MVKVLAFLAALLLIPIAAGAQQTGGTVSCGLSSTSAVTCPPNYHGWLVGIANNSTAAQTATVSCTWTGGGFVFGALGATQIITLFWPLATVGTVTCTASAAPVTTGTPSGAAPIIVELY